jgi:hypothetical protein
MLVAERRRRVSETRHELSHGGAGRGRPSGPAAAQIVEVKARDAGGATASAQCGPELRPS